MTRHRIKGEDVGVVGAQHAAPLRWVAIVVCILSASPPVRLSAQVPDTSHAPPRIVTTGAIVVPTDTAHRVRPMGAFLRSLLVPGWGQAVTGRPVAGAVFAT